MRQDDATKNTCLHHKRLGPTNRPSNQTYQCQRWKCRRKIPPMFLMQIFEFLSFCAKLFPDFIIMSYTLTVSNLIQIMLWKHHAPVHQVTIIKLSSVCFIADYNNQNTFNWYHFSEPFYHHNHFQKKSNDKVTWQISRTPFIWSFRH